LPGAFPGARKIDKSTSVEYNTLTVDSESGRKRLSASKSKKKREIDPQQIVQDLKDRLTKSPDDPKNDPRRIIRGLRIHRDVEWDYSFWRPLDWYRYDMQDHYGFIYSPGEDPRTGFYVSVQDLSEELDKPVTEEDLPALREGIMEGLKSLPDCEILEEKEIAKGFAVGFEILLTFTLDGETCKRRMRLLYNDRQQFTIYGQGVPPREYEVFHDTFEYIYSTFTFADLLAMEGIPPTPESSIKWEGGGEGVQTKPSQPRDHSAWVKERLAELDKKRGDEPE
jgi:hypothetical protein